MSEMMGADLPKSDWCDNAICVSLKDTQSAADSLLATLGKFEGKKILFYKEGTNYFAVPKNERPYFFWEQLTNAIRRAFGCEYKSVPHYANDEVGLKLADHFGSHGRTLRSKMTRCWCKRALDVNSPAFTDWYAESLLNRAEALRNAIQYWEAEESDPDQAPNRFELVPETTSVSDSIHRGARDLKTLNELKLKLDKVEDRMHCCFVSEACAQLKRLQNELSLMGDDVIIANVYGSPLSVANYKHQLTGCLEALESPDCSKQTLRYVRETTRWIDGFLAEHASQLKATAPFDDTPSEYLG